MRHIEPSVEEERGDNRFQGVDQQRDFTASAATLLATAEVQVVADPELVRRAQQPSRADYMGPQFGELAFVIFRETPKQLLADNKGEYSR